MSRNASFQFSGAYSPRAEGGAEADWVTKGLREDDAAVRMGDSYIVRAGGSAEGDRLRGLREEDASLRLGDNPLGAEGGRAEQLGEINRGTLVVGGLREEDASLRMGAAEGAEPVAEGTAEGSRAQQMGGLRESDADLRLSGLREDDAALRLSGLREDDAALRLQGLREEDAGLVFSAMRGLREEAAGLQLGTFRTAMILRGLSSPSYTLRSAYRRLGAEDFHPRFPVRVEIEGLSGTSKMLSRVQVEGLFDFLQAKPSAEVYLGAIKVLISEWAAVKADLRKLPDQQYEVIRAQMTALNNDPEKYDGMTGFLAEGYAAYTDGRWDRVQRLAAYLPTVRTIVAQYKAAGPSVTPTPAQTTQVAVKDVAARQEALTKPSFLQEAAPYAAGAAGVGLLTTLILVL
jgi:hypothetical protein